MPSRAHRAHRGRDRPRPRRDRVRLRRNRKDARGAGGRLQVPGALRRPDQEQRDAVDQGEPREARGQELPEGVREGGGGTFARNRQRALLLNGRGFSGEGQHEVGGADRVHHQREGYISGGVDLQEQLRGAGRGSAEVDRSRRFQRHRSCFWGGLVGKRRSFVSNSLVKLF